MHMLAKSPVWSIWSSPVPVDRVIYAYETRLIAPADG